MSTNRGSRRVRRGLFSGIVALFAVALTFGTLASVAFADEASDQGGVSALTDVQNPTPRANNPLSDKCGLNIVLIVDRSGSTKDVEGDYKTAAKAFVDGLVGTPSKIGLVTFNAAATLRSGYKDVSSSNNGLDAIITALPVPNSGDLTNWQDAFKVTTDNFTSSSPYPDVAVFITDGFPTTKNAGSPYDNLNSGIDAANTLKGNNKTHITGVAVGPDVSTANIEDITGSGVGLGGANPDVHHTDDPTALAALLKGFATELCGGSVTLHKTIQTGPNTFVDAAGWDFSSPYATTSPVTTDGDGLANLKFEYNKLGDETITESGTPGYSISSVDCGDKPLVGDPTANSFTVNVGQLDIVNCDVVNTPALGSIAVNKVTTHGAGGPFDFTVTGPNATNAALDATTVAKDTPTSAGTASDLYPGVYTVSESSLPDGWVLSGVDCGDATVVPGDVAVSSSIAIEVHAGENVSCTFTNDNVPSNLTIAKTAAAPVAIDNGANQQIDYTLAVDNAGPADAHVDATVVDMLPAGATLVSVTPPAGVVCDSSAAPKITCTIPADQLEVSDPAVEIGLRATVATSSTAATTIVNKSIVTSSDDPAPCTVTDTDITCSETTDNYSQVSTDIPAVEAAVVTRTEVAGATAVLAFTGGNSTPWALFGAALVGLGGLVLLVTRRRGGATS
jgi:uncharacterized repeat protein (TIGR01451 family)